MLFRSGILSSAERGALLTYLTNLSQIMTSVKSPNEVQDPRDVGIKTTFKKKSSSKNNDSNKEKSSSSKSDVIVVGGK